MRQHFLSLTLIAFLFLFLLSSCSEREQHQLIIINANILDVSSGKTFADQSIFIDEGIITEVVPTRAAHHKQKNVLDAAGKLVSPSFIDVHNHMNFVFGDTTIIEDPSLFAKHRAEFSEAYIPHGVTIVRSAGNRQAHLPLEKTWIEKSSRYVDYYPVGGALVSINTHFYNHAFVNDTTALKHVLHTYDSLGFKHVKLYSLLDTLMFKAAMRLNKKLGLRPFGHIEKAIISIEEAIDLGLKDFEHLKTLYLNVVRQKIQRGEDLSHLPPDDNENWQFREFEIMNQIDLYDPDLATLISKLVDNNASVTPTIHLYAHPLHLTEEKINIPIHPDHELNWQGEKLNRAQKGFKRMSELVFELYQRGVRLNLGTDTYQPGKAVLSEMLLLEQSGIPMVDVFKIASLNSAITLGIDDKYGSIEKDKAAHLILFDENPLTNPLNLLGKKTTIKDGVIWEK